MIFCSCPVTNDFLFGSFANGRIKFNRLEAASPASLISVAGSTLGGSFLGSGSFFVSGSFFGSGIARGHHRLVFRQVWIDDVEGNLVLS